MLNSEEKNKVNNLFQFLKQYNNIKNPTVTDISSQYWSRWIDDLPVHKNIKNNIYNDESNTDAILLVSKPEFHECPKPPEELYEWLEKGWNRFDEKLQVKNSITTYEKNIETQEDDLIEIQFEDDEERWYDPSDESLYHDEQDIKDDLYDSLIEFEAEVKDAKQGLDFIRTNRINSLEMLFDAEQQLTDTQEEHQSNDNSLIEEGEHYSEDLHALLSNPSELIKALKNKNK